MLENLECTYMVVKFTLTIRCFQCSTIIIYYFYLFFVLLKNVPTHSYLHRIKKDYFLRNNM